MFCGFSSKEPPHTVREELTYLFWVLERVIMFRFVCALVIGVVIDLRIADERDILLADILGVG